MGEYSEAFVAFDTSKAKHAVGHCQLRQPWYVRSVGGAAARVGELLCSPIVLPRSNRAGGKKAAWVR